MPKPVGSVNFSAEEKRQLRELATAGISMVEGGRRLHRDPSTVVRHSHLLGLNWRRPPAVTKAQPTRREPSPNAWTEPDDRWLLALAAAGWTVGLAANEMDRAYNTVLRHSKKPGIRWLQVNKSRRGAPAERPGDRQTSRRQHLT